MIEEVIINVVETESVIINVTEVLGKDGEKGAPGDGYIHTRERFTGSESPEIELSQVPDGVFTVFKNPALLDDVTDYSIAGTKITLNVPRINDDVITVLYKYQP